MNLPAEFISNIQNTFREEGHAFLKALPHSIVEASARWGLTDVQPVSNLSYNFVAFARMGEVLSPHDRITPQAIGWGDPAPTQNVVLKMGVPDSELNSEMAALRLFDGVGACQLLDHDDGKYWMLLERLRPGVMLATLEDDDEATHIAAEVMKRIWRPLDHVTLSCSSAKGPGDNEERLFAPLRVIYNKFILLSDWFDGLKRLRKMFNGRTGPLNERLVDRVERSVKDFFTENHRPVLLHGDFHHFNILSSGRGWLVIDPKGVIGPAGYEAGPFMLNPWNSFSDGINTRLRVKRRIDILHENLGFERERIIKWSLAHAILSAWWGVEDHTGWEYPLDFAEMLEGFK